MLIIFLLIGIALGSILTYILCHDDTMMVGKLRVDKSDPDDGPYLFLELTTSPEFIENSKRVILEVDVKNFISQK